MKHLILPNEINDYCRAVGKVDEQKILSIITEVETLYIKPVLGDSLYFELLDKPFDYEVLLEGGRYESKCGGSKSVIGIKSAVAYFVYAHIIMTGDFQTTRYGTVIKHSDYSENIGAKSRSDFYNHIFEIAQQYLKECIKYCKDKNLIRGYSPYGVGLNGITIRKIGK